MRTIFVLLVVVGLAAGGGAYYMTHMAATPPSTYRMATVTRGDLLETISATGTLEPEEVVDVGAQVMGRIWDLGIDFEVEKRKSKIRPQAEVRKAAAQEASDAQKTPAPLGPHKNIAQPIPATQASAAAGASVARPAGSPARRVEDKRPRIDYGSIVHQGTELAYIDDAIYDAQVKQAKASFDRSVADLGQLEAKAKQAAAELARAEKLRVVQAISDPQNLRPIKAISDSDYDLVLANDRVAKANLEVGKAMVEQSRAALKLAETNYSYAQIISPVEGVVIDRRVNIGQTVVASLNAPSLFLIAKDLSRMQVWSSVNEADIGRIRQGMNVKFTVDAYPGETFEGRVIQTRLNATMTQNVVTYTVVVETENPDGKLLPYLTANVQFEVEHLQNVLRVPNAALRWKARPAQMAPDIREKLASAKGSKGGKGGGKGRAEGKSPGDPAAPKIAKQREDGRVWIKDGDFVRPVDVKIGSSDGTLTAISGPELKDDMEVVIGEEVADQGATDAENPFAPKLFKGGFGKK